MGAVRQSTYPNRPCKSEPVTTIRFADMYISCYQYSMLKSLINTSRSPSRKARPKPVLAHEPSRSDLEYIRDVLNSEASKGATELRRLIERWFASGPNLQKMLHSDSVLWKGVQHSWESLYIPTRTERARIALFPAGPGADKQSAEAVAHTIFAALTLNPRCDLLAGPCVRCHSYYIKKTRHQKVYCSQRCGSAATALPAVRKKRAAEHARKVKEVQAVVSGLRPTSRNLGWKERVCERTGVTVKWLSRAANKGELSLPRFVQSRQ
jgi:hypothetical protein